MYICVDFDGTIVDHRFPEIGPPVPGALDWMKKWQVGWSQIDLVYDAVRWRKERECLKPGGRVPE